MAAPALKQDTTKTYPRREGWNYIATPEEDAELQKLRNIRAAIDRSREQFERGEGIPLSRELFDDIKKTARAKYLAQQQ